MSLRKRVPALACVSALLFLFLPSVLLAQSPVYVVNSQSQTVSVIDNTGAVTATINVPNGSGFCSGSQGNLGFYGEGITIAAVSPDGGQLYVVSNATNSVAVLDLTATPPRPIGSIPVGNCPTTLTLSPDGTRLYVVETGAGRVGVVDVSHITTSGMQPPEIADVFIGGYPQGAAVAPDGNHVWVTDSRNNVIDIIDSNPTDGSIYNTVVNSFPVQTNPQIVAFSPDGSKAYITCASQNTVDVIDAVNTDNLPPHSSQFPPGQAISIPLQLPGQSLEDVVVSADGTKVLVTVLGQSAGGYLAVIDTSNNNSVSMITVGSGPFWVTYNSDASRVYVTNHNDNNVSVLNPNNSFAPVGPPLPVGNGPFGVATRPASASGTGGSFVPAFGYVSNSAAGTVAMFDVKSNTVLANIAVGPNPLGVAITPDGASLYVDLQGSNQVAVIDTNQRLVLTYIPVGMQPTGIALAPNGARAYVTNRADNTVSVIDTATNTVVTTLPAGQTPVFLSVSPDGSLLYVANHAVMNAGSLSIYDLAGDGLAGTIFGLGQPYDIRFSPDSSTVYVANGLGVLSVINAATEALINSVPVTGNYVAVAPDGNRLYVTGTNGSSSGVFVLDAHTFAQLAFIPVNTGVAEIVVTPDGSTAYVVEPGAGSVAVINTTNNTVVNTFPFGSPAFVDDNNIVLGKSPSLTVATPTGTNVTTSGNAVSLTFSGVSSPGSTTITSIPPSEAGITPSGYTILSFAWEITTTANYTAPLTICFQVPSVTDPIVFSSLRVLHNLNGTLVDQTILSGPNAPNFTTHAICAQTNSLSPFVIAKLGGSTLLNTSSSISAPSITYGSVAQITASVSTTSGQTASGNVSLSGDGIAPTSQQLSNGSATFSVSGLAAGTHNLSISFPSQGNFNASSASGSIYVAPASLTITANNATKLLNALNPSPFSATYSGFVSAEGPSVLSGTLSCTTTATTSSSVGSYPITCSGQSSTNYSINYVPGALKILYASAGPCDGNVGHQILQPINADGSSVWKQGSTVPAIFRVCDANGVSVGTMGVVSAFTLYQITAGTVTSVDESPTSTNADTAFRWDPTGLQWIYNISTKVAPVNGANATYFFRIDLNDGTSVYFDFGLR